MEEQTRYAEYDAFAPVYERFWGEGTEQFLPIVQALLLDALPPGAHVLDLCCGNGWVSAQMMAQGFRVTGVDGSEAMLAYARQRAPEAAFVLADARAFSLTEQADAAVSTYDSLNHVLSLDDLAAVFRRVRAALKPGAPFLFDLNTDEGFRRRWKDHSFALVEDDCVVAARSQYDEAARLAQISFTVFQQGEGWERSDTTLQQRAYEDAEVEAALRASGFGAIEMLDAERLPDSLPALPRGRTFYRAWSQEEEI